MAGVHAGHRLVITGSSSLSAGCGKLVKMKNNLRFLHIGRKSINWRKATTQRLTDRGMLLARCTTPALHG